ncbi:MAG: hypothetical protein E7056_07430 [Lentisphaerae bacterium]|nr:hypothetical protein [Lentisphaerota bacterium]
MSEISVKVKKYNVAIKWDKIRDVLASKVLGYELDFNNSIKRLRKNSFSIKNAPVSTDNTVRVRAYSANGYGAWSEVEHFAVKDVTAPTVGKVKVEQLSEDTFKLSYGNASDNVGIEDYEILVNGTKIDETDQKSYIYTTASPAGKLKFTVIAEDEAGNRSKAANVSIKIKDMIAPESVSNIRVAGQATEKRTELIWDPATDNSGKVTYLINVNGKLYKSSKNTIKLKKLSVGEHTVTIKALDKSKNESAPVSFTFNAIDVTAPKAGKLQVVQNAADKATLSVKQSGDNVNIKEFIFYLNGNYIGSSTDGNLVYNQLLYGKSMNFSVIAIDEAGNRSKAAKAKLKVKDWIPPAQVAGVHIVGTASQKSTVIAWTPAQDNVKTTGYIVTVDGKQYRTGKNSLTLKNLAVGEHSVTVSAYDKAQNTGKTSQIMSFDISDSQPVKALNLTIKGMDIDTYLTKYEDADLPGGVPKTAVYSSINGSSLADTVTVESNKFAYINGTVNLYNGQDKITVGSNSVVKVKSEINLGAGDDTLHVKKLSTFESDNGSIIFGSGDDKVLLDGIWDMNFSGNRGLIMGDGNDVIEIANGTIEQIESNFSTGSGNDTIELSGKSVVEADLTDFGNGNDKLIIGQDSCWIAETDDGPMVCGIDFGSGNDLLQLDGLLGIDIPVNYTGKFSMFANLEEITGKGELAIRDIDKLPSALLAQFEQSGITISEVSSVENYRGRKAEKADDSKGGAIAIKYKDTENSFWLNSHAAAAESPFGVADEADWFKLDIGTGDIKLDSIMQIDTEVGKVKVDISNGSGAVLDSFTVYDEKNIALKQFGQQAIYVKLSLADGAESAFGEIEIA